MANTRQCPSCRQWVDIGYRNERRAFERHIKECDPEMYKRRRAHDREVAALPDDMVLRRFE